MGKGQGEHPSTDTGAQFGKYRIVRRLGEGAFGAVYEALLPGPMGFTKKVAIKRLHPRLLGSDQRFVQSMINEARIGGLLHHANIVDILEFGQVDANYYLAMEYVDGTTLDEIIALCRKQRVLLPRFAAIDMAAQASRGLHYAHELEGPDARPLNLIHRDLKPSNIILDRQGTAKILDFGNAKAASNLFDETAPGFVKGTPRYMSPEQLKGEPLTPASDVWSLGVVLYELVTARHLFVAESLMSLMHQVASADISVRLDEAEAAFPGMGVVLGRALARDLSQRYPDARELGNDLRRLGRDFHSDADLSEVVARLLPRVDRTETREIANSDDLARDMADEPVEDETGTEEIDNGPITPPGVDSSGWMRFTSAFPTSAEIAVPGATPEALGITTAEPTRRHPASETLDHGSTPLPGEPADATDDDGASRRVILWVVAGGLLLLLVAGVSGVAGYLLSGDPQGGAVHVVDDDDSALDDDDSALDDDDSAPAEPPDLGPPPPDDDATGDDDITHEPTPEPALPGRISISVSPWSAIWIDDVCVASQKSQLPGQVIQSGSHVIRLVCGPAPPTCPTASAEMTFEVTVDGDDVTVEGRELGTDKDGYPLLKYSFQSGEGNP
jgi:eukaryotic-like serine/threonine-protein kinase